MQLVGTTAYDINTTARIGLEILGARARLLQELGVLIDYGKLPLIVLTNQSSAVNKSKLIIRVSQTLEYLYISFSIMASSERSRHQNCGDHSLDILTMSSLKY